MAPRAGRGQAGNGKTGPDQAGLALEGRIATEVSRAPSPAPMLTRAMHCVALATDYDGTIAHDGEVDAPTMAVLERLRGAIRRLILVTGRKLDGLVRCITRLDLFHAIVAENGAVLHWPATERERTLAAPPPPPPGRLLGLGRDQHQGRRACHGTARHRGWRGAAGRGEAPGARRRRTPMHRPGVTAAPMPDCRRCRQTFRKSLLAGTHGFVFGASGHQSPPAE